MGNCFGRNVVKVYCRIYKDDENLDNRSYNITVQQLSTEKIKEIFSWNLSSDGLDPDIYLVACERTNNIYEPMTNSAIFKNIREINGKMTLYIKVICNELEYRKMSFWTQFIMPFGNL